MPERFWAAGKRASEALVEHGLAGGHDFLNIGFDLSGQLRWQQIAGFFADMLRDTEVGEAGKILVEPDIATVLIKDYQSGRGIDPEEVNARLGFGELFLQFGDPLFQLRPGFIGWHTLCDYLGSFPGCRLIPGPGAQHQWRREANAFRFRSG